jgi:hypothetical protein
VPLESRWPARRATAPFLLGGRGIPTYTRGPRKNFFLEPWEQLREAVFKSTRVVVHRLPRLGMALTLEQAQALQWFLVVATIGTCVGVWCLLGVSCLTFVRTYGVSCLDIRPHGENAPRSSSQLEMSRLVTSPIAAAQDTGGAWHPVQCSCKKWIQVREPHFANAF